MGRLRVRSALLGLVFGVAGCAEEVRPPVPPSPPPPPAEHAPAFLRPVSFFVADAEIRGIASDKQYGERLRGIVEARLVSLGYHVVDAATAHDAAILVRATQDRKQPSSWTYSLAVTSNGESIFETSELWREDDDRTADLLIAPLAHAESLAVLARRTHPSAQAEPPATGFSAPAPMEPAPESLRRVTLAVADADIRGASSDDNYAQTLRRTVEARLVIRGYRVVDAATAPTATVHIVATQDEDHPTTWTYALGVTAPGELLLQTTSAWLGDDAATADQLIAPLAHSGRMALLAHGAAGAGAISVAGHAAPDRPRPSGSEFTPGAPQPTAYAVIIGVEKYQEQLPPPTGARADAERFAELAKTSLGVAPGHIMTALDERATKGGIEAALEWAKSSTPSGGRIYFFFSGHGAPDASGGASYLVPTDGNPRFLAATGLPMKEVLSKLGESKAREVVAFVDACFSGTGGRSVLPPGARPLVRLRPEATPPQLVLFSASSGAETSGPAHDGSGGAFTKYLLEGLGRGSADINGDGQVSLDELSEWVTPRVARDAKGDNRAQTPNLTVGKGLGASSAVIVEWGLWPK